MHIRDFYFKLIRKTAVAFGRKQPREILDLIYSLRPIATLEPLIRLGSKHDGGYLIPNELESIKVGISPGIANEVSFDIELASRNIPTYMFDGSVEGPPIENPKFHFQKKFLDNFDDANNIRLETLVKTLASEKGDLILQMDIEGAEWRVIADTSQEILERFKIMVIEFHDLNKLFDPEFNAIYRPVFNKVLETHHVVHIHANNCCPSTRKYGIVIPPVIEFSFLRKDSRFSTEKSVSLPHPLDSDCMPELQELKLDPYWWKSD